jgi:type I restriction enzyme S subunit
MKNGSVNIDTVKYITDEIHDKIKAYKISKDDVYITVAGTIGDLVLFQLNLIMLI